MSFNNLTAVGYTAQDCELRYSGAGTPILNFRIAFDAGYGDKKHTIFMGCVLFGKQAEALEPHLPKGKLITVNGELQESTWQTDDGQKRSKFEIKVNSVKFLGGRSEGSSDSGTPPDEVSDIEAF